MILRYIQKIHIRFLVVMNILMWYMGFLCSSVGKEFACSAGGLGSIPGLGRSPGEGNGNPLQYLCLENLLDRGAWWTAVHGVSKSQARLSNFHFLSLQRLICWCRSSARPPKIDTGPCFLPPEGLILFCFGGPRLPGNLAGFGMPAVEERELEEKPCRSVVLSLRLHFPFISSYCYFYKSQKKG